MVNFHVLCGFTATSPTPHRLEPDVYTSRTSITSALERDHIQPQPEILFRGSSQPPDSEPFNHSASFVCYRLTRTPPQV
ncbi:hypothetical protein PROFUN_07215 [Planoprotostelium fungivorum]|uniref:Uncharacterized protein n=1 Tax=Planoprotostelium fungivorum TaxID=1890364 RepID=A0A2P6NMF0_9EUKA|nr:hypothetical protein PROFUN_07215 [Planoprotostelium fungivorum]